MKDISYEILDLLKTCGADRAGCDWALASDHRPEVLYALSPMRENVAEWLELEADDQVLQLGSGYGALTGLLASRCAHVTVIDRLDENLAVNRERNAAQKQIVWKSCPAGPLSAGAEKKEYSWIFLCGPQGEEELRQELETACPLLSSEGRFVLVCENRLGLPYLAGASHDGDEASFTRGGLKTLLARAGLASLEWYYLLPDSHLPSAVYSDRYLPLRGDLSGSTVSYDGPRCCCMKEEEVYDQLLEEGDFPRFAPGFLVIASRGAAPQKTIFAKYNRTRKPEFQIRTRICEEEGRRYVEKSALSKAGNEHIQGFQRRYEQLRDSCPAIRFLEPQPARGREDAACVRFAFLKGVTLAETLGQEIREGKAPAGKIQEVMDQLFPVEGLGEFAPTSAFSEVFGEIPPLTDRTYPVSNIDGLFENLMYSDGALYCLDYEWVFSFPIPAGFVRYRNLAYFYYKYREKLCYASLDAFLREFGITPELAKVYGSMEASFQSWVHGDGSQGYLANYAKPVVTLEELKGRDQELSRATDRILQLQAEVEEKNLQIRKEQEIQRLTNNHVANLEIMIKDLRHEIDELGKLATYLNGHEALVFKARRKLGAEVNRAFPKGTRKRKLLNYSINTVKHPIRYARLYASEEGRNRIEGDFQIGEAYMKYGKLVFPQEAHPKVSIVIPCYNQVGYTYACLRSILEYTKDVTYEVIIADDVSTDATANLSQYAEGLVIRRNQTNQGFLLNCNQAAEAARGDYILFLNNDTTVTEHWLSSLVTLIESDASIGMVGSKLVYPDGRLQEAGGIIWSDGSGWNYGRLGNPDSSQYNYVKDVDYISGAAIMLSAALWRQIGGFDERYAPAYYEDVDLAFAVRRAGLRVVYQPLSKVIHFEGISNGTDVNGTGLKRYQVENAEKFKKKWAQELKHQQVNTGSPNPFLARERSQGKKVILVIDHYVPTFDKDAGSKALYQYMQMFLKKGFVVKFLGDNFLHEEPYTTALEQMGIEVLYGDEYAAGIWDWLKTNGEQMDFAYLNRPHIATKYVDFIQDYTRMKVLYWGCDLHFLRLGREYQLTGDIEQKREADYWKSMELTMMYKAAVSYYPSTVEVEVIRSIDASIRVKALPLYAYEVFHDHIEENFAEREGLLFIGGFAHPPNADGVIWFAEEIFPRIRKSLPQVEFHVVGSKVTDEVKALAKPGNGIIIHGFVSDEKLDQLYKQCKLVVVPLRYGAGVKGKVVESLYNGAPIVTTSIGAEGIPFVETALEIADEPDCFADRVIRLYQDNERCRRMALATQDYMKRYFSMERVWKVMEEDLQ